MGERRCASIPRSTVCGPPSCLSSLNASRMAFCAGGPAAWDPLPTGFHLGAGPTTSTAQGHVSKKADDTALVAAAGRGAEREVALLLPRATSPNVRAKVCLGKVASQGHATTPLHAAAARGALSVVKLLLEGAADPNTRQSGLRMITPLHEAATVEIAEVLLNAGARTSTRDPREPDPAWYHRQRGRHDVADAILAASRLQASAPLLPPASPSRPSQQPRPQKVFPCMTTAEMAAAKQAWKTSGSSARSACRASTPRFVEGQEHGKPWVCSDGDFECAICMLELKPDDECLLVPCNSPAANGGGGLRPGTVGYLEPLAQQRQGTPHVFHLACIEQWWLKSCRCPTCRRDVRPLLPLQRQGSAAEAGPPRSLGLEAGAFLRRHPTLMPPQLTASSILPAVQRPGGGIV